MIKLGLNDFEFRLGSLEVNLFLGDVEIGEPSQPQLLPPTNLTASGIEVTFDESENATSYEVYADGVLIGESEGTPVPSGFTVTVNVTGDTADMFVGTWAGALHVYDGTDTSGADLGNVLVTTGSQFTISSGHIYLDAGVGQHTDDRLNGATSTGGVTNAYATDYRESSHPYASADVSGDGVFTINTYLY